MIIVVLPPQALSTLQYPQRNYHILYILCVYAGGCQDGNTMDPLSLTHKLFLPYSNRGI